MGKCSKDQCNRDAPKGCVKALCGNCCQPRCAEDVHDNRGRSRGQPGKPKEARWHAAWRDSFQFVAECLKDPGAVKFMKSEHLRPQEVFDAIFKMMVLRFREPCVRCDLDPENLQLHEKMATLTSIIPPRDLMHAISAEHRQDPLWPYSGEPPEQGLPQSGFSSSSGPATLAPSSPSQLVLPHVSGLLMKRKTHDEDFPPGNWNESSVELELKSRQFEIPMPGQSSDTRPWTDLHLDPRSKPDQETKFPKLETPLPTPISARIPVTRGTFVADACNAQGLLPLDSAGDSTRHWQRSFPALYCTTKQVLAQFGHFSTDKPHYDVDMVKAWLEKRESVDEQLSGVFPKEEFPWDTLKTSSHNFGKWWFAPLRKSIPENRDLCRVSSATNPVKFKFEKAIHGTNFYSLMNIFEHGLRCGPWEVKSKPGIFSFKPFSDSRAKSGSGYRTYSDLMHNGHFWAPLLEISFREDLPLRVGSITAGQQTLTPEADTFITGVWFHCVHVSEHAQAEECGMNCCCDDWMPSYEMRRGQNPGSGM
jgi:hypothetical protein